MAYTPTEYNATAASPSMNATNMLKSEYGIKDAHLMAQVVDCSSRVAEYTGDGIPLIPDNVAGQTYLQDAFATVDSWTATGGTASVSGGNLLMTYSGTSGKIERAFTSFSAKMIRSRVKSNVTGTINLYGTVGGVADTLINSISVQAGIYYLIGAYVSGAVTSLYFSITSPVSGNIIYIDWVYVGTGAYDTVIKDRSGNSNGLTNYSIRPVDGKLGKEMSFNGSSSYAQASSPVIGVVGSIKVLLKLNALGSTYVIFDNRDVTGYNGVMLLITSTGAINFVLRGASGSSHEITTSQTITALSYNTIDVEFSTSQMVIYLNGVAISTTAISITATASKTNLTIGMRNNASYINGYVAIIRYDARVFSADEARAWYLNPISIDSRV